MISARKSAMAVVLFAGFFLIAQAGLPLPAQAGVQWMTVETPHFYIHFAKGQEQVAAEAAVVAEDVHERLTARLGYKPDQKTQLVLSDFTDLYNGSADWIGQRIEIFTTYPTPASEYSDGDDMKWESLLRDTITHEYAHVLQTDMSSGMVAEFRQFFGRVPWLSTPNALLPTSFLEGFAIYEETANTAGGRGRSPYFDMFLRAATLEGKLLKPDQAFGLYPLDRWSPTGNAYLYGYAFLAYLAERYGQAKVFELNREFSKGVYFGPDGLLRKVVGVSLSRLWNDWQESLRQKYARQAEELKRLGLTSTEELKIARTVRVAVDPAYSPDGRYIAYGTQDDRALPALRLLEVSGGKGDRNSKDGEAGEDGKAGRAGKDRQIITGPVAYTGGFSWAPDGRRLVYARLDNVDDRRQFGDLYTYDLGSRTEHRLTQGMRAGAPAWSPDGTQILFVAKDGLTSRLMRMNPDGTGVAEVLAGQNQTQFFSPAWSPDGKQVALGLWQQGGFVDIYVLDAGTWQFTPVTRDRAADTSPAWSPDGRYILFDSDRSGVHNLYAYEVASQKLFRITNMLYGAFNPTVSPDGRTIAFMNYTAEGYRLATMPFRPESWVEVPYRLEEPPEPEKYDLAELARLGYRVYPYSPVESLLPRYWLPAVGADEMGSRYGLTTSGMDALQERAYSLTATYGLESGSPGYQVEYSQTFGDKRRPTLTITAGDEPVPEPVGADWLWLRRQTASAEISLVTPRWNSAQLLACGLEYQRYSSLSGLSGLYWNGPSREEEVTVGRAGWEHVKMGGRDNRLWVRDVGASLEKGIGAGMPGYSAVVGWNGKYGVPSRNLGMMELLLGYAQDSGYFALGGTKERGISSATLRGYGPGEFAGSKLAGMTVEYRQRLARIERGTRDLPSFFNRLTGVIFADAGTVWDEEVTPVKASYGVELRLTNQYLWGNFPEFDWRLGVAKAMEEKRPARVYFSIGSAF